MILSKNAVGNLINRYKAVLGKCRLLNTFGSLALAAALTLGSAGLAVAVPTWGPTEDVVIEVVESVTGSPQAGTLKVIDNGELKNDSASGHIYVGGETLLEGTGEITLNNTTGYGLVGAADSAAEFAGEFTGSFAMTGGTLTIDGSQLQVDAVNISGGTATISGQIGVGTNWDDGAQLVGGLNGGDFNMTGGNVTLGDYAQMVGGNINISGGSVALDGTFGADAILRSYGTDNALTLSGGGTISVDDFSYGVITANQVNISGGTIDVGGELILAAALTKGQDLPDALADPSNYSTAIVSQTGGTVTIADTGKMTLNKNVDYTLTGGSLSNAGELAVADSYLNLEKTATFSNTGNITVFTGMIHMDGGMGTEPLLTDGTGQVTLGYGGQLLFTRDDGSVVDLTGKLADMISAGPGKIVLNPGSSITGIAGIRLGDASFDYSGATLATNSLQAGEDGAFTVQNGTINAGEFSLLGSDPSGTALTVAAGGALTLGQSSYGTEAVPLPVGGRIADTLNNAGNTTIEAGDNWSAGAVTNSGGTFTVAGGKLTVGDLDVQAGSVIVGVYDGGAGLHIEGSIKSVADGNFSDGINVLTNGVLSGDAEKFVTYSGDAANRAVNLAKIYVSNGSTLRLDGLESVNTQQMINTKTSLLAAGSSGLISYGGAAIEISSADEGSSPGSIKGAAAELTGAVMAGITAEYDGSSSPVSVGAAGNFGVDALVIINNPGDVEVAIDDDITLLGNGGQLIATANDKKADVTVAGGKNLNLGSTGATPNGGTLNGNVELQGIGSALNVAAASYTVGDITAGTSGNGHVIVGAGGGLITGAIGTAIDAVNNVSANSGALAAASIDAAAVSATNGGTILSTGAITAGLGGVNVTNGGTVVSAETISTLSSVMVSDGNVAAKTLVASSDVTVIDGTLLTSGTAADSSSVAGDLTLIDSKAVLGDMDVTGTTNITGGSLAASGLTVGADSTFTNGAQVTVGSLDAAGNTITVGDAGDTKSTSLVVEDLTLDGGMLLIDPDWAADGPNKVVIGSMSGSEIDGNVGVGQNSLLTIGDTSSAWLTEQVNAATNGAGLTPGGVTAALGLKEAQVLGDTNNDGTGTGYSLVVDGSMDDTALGTHLTASPATATFADNSLLVVTAAAASAPAGALSATTATTATIGDSAKLRITDAKVGQHYTVLGSNMTVAPTYVSGWTGSNFSTDSRMINGSFDAATGVLSTALNSAANVYPKLDGELVKVLDNAYTADQVGPAHVDSDVKGVRFLSRATSDNFIGGNADLAAKTIESAARIAVAGAVPQMTMAANNAAGAAITQRTSIAQPDGNGMQSVSLDKTDGVNKKGMALWIMPLYQNQNAWSMEAGNNYDLKWHGGLGGVALGGDYTFDNALRAGIAFNIGGGYAEGEGDLAKTTNSFNFWGLGAYAGWAVENFGLTADVNYTSTYNKVKQELPGAMQMRDLKSDITAYALSTGLRAEYKLNTQYVDIIPHLGVRYMYVNTNSYDVKSNGTVMHGDEMNQNIWTFPIGVTFSKQVETGSGWYVKPSLDLGVIPATGDIEAKSKIRFTGTGTKAELDTHTMDYMSYTGGLGLDFGNDNLSLGVNYNIQASEHSTSHGVFGTVRYEF